MDETQVVRIQGERTEERANNKKWEMDNFR